VNDFILVTDIGSTTTKALLLEIRDGRFVPVETAEEPTTVESPHEDVRVGLFRAVDRMAGKTRLSLREGDRFTVPYYTTSSAGGGLQILVVALASWDTGVMARAVTCGAGGVVLDSFTIDDETPRVEKMRRMSTLSPDLVIMAGGYEGGAVAGVINMAHLLALAAPRPKYGQGRLPVVYCGNTKARGFVKETLGDGFELHFAPNIRPSGLEFNLQPAIASVHGLFMEHVMQMAPGYHRVAEAASAPVIPTPTGVERILSLFARGREENLVLADMGGATTDVFSIVGGAVQRTVSSNIGMSYSLSNILREAGNSMVSRHIPGLDSNAVRDRVLSKTLFPTLPPADAFGNLVEHACAAEGVRLAFQQHLEFAYKRERVGFLDRLKLLDRCRYEETFKTLDGSHRFKLSGFSTLIGAGGVLAHSGNLRAAWMLAQGFHPPGVTTLMVDSLFQSPHMGVLSGAYPEPALDYYSKTCLRKICRVVTPSGAVRDGRPAITVMGPHGETKVSGGDFLFIPDAAGCRAGDWDETENIPLLVDCRTKPEQTIPIDFRKAPIEIAAVPPAHSRKAVFAGPVHMRHTFTLPYPGEILVKPGEGVQPGTLLGRNRLSPPMVYFIDVRASAGYDDDIASEEVLSHVKVLVGDEVSLGQEVFRSEADRRVFGKLHSVRSPVRGRVTGIIPPGLIRLTEIQDYDGKPHVVDVAGPLGIKPRHIGRYLKARKGDFVHRGQTLAEGAGFALVKSPSAGTVTEVDSKAGRVVVQYVTSPVDLLCPVHGTVTGAVPESSVEVSFEGMRMEGILGVGRNAHGTISTAPGKGGLLLAEGPVLREHIESARQSGTRGIIGSSISAGLLAEYLGHEPGVILTGSEDLPVSLLIVSGVGSIPFGEEALQRLRSSVGSHGALFTTTRIRAGVERPWLLVES